MPQWHNTVGTAVGCLLHFSLMGLIPSLLARVACKHEQFNNNNNNNNDNNMKNAPGKEEVENFWREIYGKKVSHNEEACWIKDQCQHNPRMEWSPICEKEVTEALRPTLSWKAPGIDQIPNFWLKQLTTRSI